MHRAVLRRQAAAAQDVSRLVKQRIAAQVSASTPPPPSSSSASSEAIAVVPVELAHDLLYEVGWESRHVYVDTRDPETFARGRPRGAVNVPFAGEGFEKRAKDAIADDHGRLVVGGPLASDAAKRLHSTGYRPVVLDAGFEVWRQRGFPVDVRGLEGSAYHDDDHDDDGDPAKW